MFDRGQVLSSSMTWKVITTLLLYPCTGRQRRQVSAGTGEGSPHPRVNIVHLREIETLGGLPTPGGPKNHHLRFVTTASLGLRALSCRVAIASYFLFDGSFFPALPQHLKRCLGFGVWEEISFRECPKPISDHFGI